MGFSANQARFLSLTSRQVDLEYRMQQICQRRLRLSSELENIATDYNNTLSDRRLFTMDTSQSIQNFTIGNLRGLTDNSGQKYIAYYHNTTGSAINNISHANHDIANNAIVSITSDAEISAILGAEGHTVDGSGNVNGMPALEYAIRTGIIQLGRPSDEYTQENVNNTIAISQWNSGTSTMDQLVAASTSTGYEQVDWRTMTDIADELYKANDVNAEAEYEAAVEKINSQDKKLQLEQSQIEVEHKAIVTQKDAVKNIINKNIESSFKTFS